MKKRLALLLVAVMGMSSLGQAAYAAEDFGYYGGIISEDTGEQDISELDIITESILPETESEEYGQAGEIPSAAGLVEENPEADVLASDAALQDGLSETDWPDEEIFIAEDGEDADDGGESPDDPGNSAGESFTVEPEKNEIVEDIPTHEASEDLSELLEAAEADETASEADFIYIEQDNGSIQILNYTGTSTNVTMPGEISGKMVESFVSSAFSSNTFIKKVVLPESIAACRRSEQERSRDAGR